MSGFGRFCDAQASCTFVNPTASWTPNEFLLRWPSTSGSFETTFSGEVCALAVAPNGRVTCTLSQEEDAGFIEDNIDLMDAADDILLTEANADTSACC